MNYCGQPFAHASNPLAVCGMIDPKRVYQCDQCAALSGQTCSHGQLKRVCRECELEAEIEALRAQVADKDCAVAMLAAQTVAKSKLLGENLVLKARIADLEARLATAEAQLKISKEKK